MTKRLGLYLGNRTSDRHQISKTNPSEGKDYVTASISTFINCGIWSLFANSVTYVPSQGKPTIWGCLPKFSYVSRRLHEQWAEPPRKFENDRLLGCGVILTTMIKGQQFCMSTILSYMQFYNGTKAKQTLFAYLRTRTSRHAFACSSTTPTWTRRDVFLYQP